MKKLCLILASLFILSLFGCNGHNEESVTSSSQVVANIELSLFDSEGKAKQSFGKNEG